MAGLRSGLLGEIVTMSIDTLRASKMRSALTVLGVVIGITSIVGMTSLIRGFDESLRDSIRELGPNTIFVQKMGALSFASGKSFLDLIRRPNITRDDARAVARDSPSVAMIDVWLGGSEQPELGCPAQEGTLAELPLLPRAIDAATVAVYVQAVLSGEKPAPAPLQRQVDLLERALARLGTAPAQERRA